MRALDRREFLYLLGAMTLGACAREPRRLARIGVQLYTVRAELQQDFDGTLDRLAAIGFREVEFAGYFGRTPAQVRAAVERAGLTAPGTHVAFELLDAGWAQAVDDAAAAGHNWIVVPWVPESARRNADDWRHLAERFNRAGAQAHRGGLRFAYHTQEYDFHSVDSVTPFETLADATDRTFVDFELDVYWAVNGGGDPAAILGRHRGRMPLMHLKDAAGPEHIMADVGAGDIDWPAVLELGRQAGLQHAFVEHDAPADPMASLRASFRYLEGISL